MTGPTVGGSSGDRSAPSRLREEGRHNRSLCHDQTAAILTRDLLGCSAKENVERNKAISSREEDSVRNERRKHRLIPSKEKDEGYWDKRRKNNEAAKRSREKRRANDMVLETRVLSLLEENARLRAELLAIKFRFGLVKDFSDVSILPLTQSTQPDSHEPSYPSVHSCNHHQQDTTYEKTRPAPSAGEFVEKQQPYSTHPLWLHANIQDSPNAFRSLPHKLRFKAPGGEKSPPLHQHSAWGVRGFGQEVWSSEEACVSGDQQHHNPSCGDPAESVSLRSQISCLSQEVARLQQLFSHQLVSKNV
ncbi:nuclear factor interleukin-3-regulated protein-like isoform X2 [Dunckerocampus dactyliophorus]|uniref:nuclear factor interleukin-3-regulated protein-like isoform X2 n=1 Tax=Dunckerocampus dactyliophorus TaxID=161453 RepID=UPI0024075926|nr:nuclear factor interleukin-3-regulated protein-like isoform X2 [Dunckerocampus dactyliophorus]